MKNRVARAVFAAALILVTALTVSADEGGLSIENPVWKTDAPDPTVWQAGDRYYAASTHGLDILESRDLVHWKSTGRKLLEPAELAWIHKTWPHVWAPDVIKMGEWYNLYICYHNEGAHTAIAVYRSKNSCGPFTDRRIILKSEDDHQHEVIDPEVVRDETGRIWLFFGHGDIRRVELTADGLARKPGAGIEHVAGVEWSVRGEKKWWGPECTTEGPYLYRRGGKWYLFVSQGGWNDETYQVAVGRADSIDGRFFDKLGRPMVLGFATTILKSEKGDEFFGPGHNGEIFATPAGRTYMFYHCHWAKSPDRKPDSWYVPRPLFLQEILWDKDGWPYFGNGGKPL